MFYIEFKMYSSTKYVLMHKDTEGAIIDMETDFDHLKIVQILLKYYQQFHNKVQCQVHSSHPFNNSKVVNQAPLIMKI